MNDAHPSTVLVSREDYERARVSRFVQRANATLERGSFVAIDVGPNRRARRAAAAAKRKGKR